MKSTVTYVIHSVYVVASGILVNEDTDGKLIYQETDSLKGENLFLELGN